jgi:hypothetical protein
VKPVKPGFQSATMNSGNIRCNFIVSNISSLNSITVNNIGAFLGRNQLLFFKDVLFHHVNSHLNNKGFSGATVVKLFILN